MRTVRTTSILAAVLLLAGAGGCSRVSGEEGGATAQAGERSRDFIRLDPKSPRLDFIKIEVVKESEGASRIALPGRIAFDEDHTQRVSSPIDGRVTALLVKVGDKVKAGQPLLQLSSPHVGQLQSDAQKATSDLGLAEKSVERAHKLKADGAISEKELTQVEGEYRKAKSDFGRTTAQLKSLGVSATDPAVNVALRAQIAGVVVERNVLVGQEVRSDSAAPLLTVSSLDSVWVLADAYEQDLGMVEDGAAVTIRVPAYPNETFSGNVKHIGDVVDQTSRTVKIRAVADNPGHRLKPEMYAKVDVQNVKGAKFIAIPSKAVLNDGDRAMVVVATEGNVFRTRVVQTGPEMDEQIRILGGLTPGEKIVASGAIFMKQEIDSK